MSTWQDDSDEEDYMGEEEEEDDDEDNEDDEQDEEEGTKCQNFYYFCYILFTFQILKLILHSNPLRTEINRDIPGTEIIGMKVQ